MRQNNNSRTSSNVAAVVVVAGVALWTVMALAGGSKNAPTTSSTTKSSIAVLLASVGDHIGAKRWLNAVDDAERLVAELRDHAPLRVKRVLVVADPPRGLGRFVPLSNVTVPRRTVQLYVEVDNVATIVDDSGRHPVRLSVDGEFFFQGESIGTRALGEHRELLPEQPGVVAFGLDFSLSEKAPAGSYQLKLVVKDDHSKTASGNCSFILPEIASAR